MLQERIVRLVGPDDRSPEEVKEGVVETVSAGIDCENTISFKAKSSLRLLFVGITMAVFAAWAEVAEVPPEANRPLFVAVCAVVAVICLSVSAKYGLDILANWLLRRDCEAVARHEHLARHQERLHRHPGRAYRQ